MPISASATISVNAVAKAVDVVLIFSPKTDVANAPLLRTEK